MSNQQLGDEQTKGMTCWSPRGVPGVEAEQSDGIHEESRGAFSSHRTRWTMGMLNDKETDEVPGSVLLLPSYRNKPLGFHSQPEMTGQSGVSLSSGMRQSLHRQKPRAQPWEGRAQMRLRSPSQAVSLSPVKRTADGQVVLQPQPEDSLNDPLNWPVWRRDAALLSLGFLCMLGGGTTPILAAGYNDVAEQYGVTSQDVALTTGFYMLGLGVGSVIVSPTAILFGKRPVYLFGVLMFILTAVWCAASPNYNSLLVARVFQGIAVSPVECLPSATIAEIFFLHERAYRIGIYTLLMLGGKNLIPLVSAAITQGLGWRWVFWIISMVVGCSGVLVYIFVPETFWDRTPRPRTKNRHNRHHYVPGFMHNRHRHNLGKMEEQPAQPFTNASDEVSSVERCRLTPRHRERLRVGLSGESSEADACGDEKPAKVLCEGPEFTEPSRDSYPVPISTESNVSVENLESQVQSSNCRRVSIGSSIGSQSEAPLTRPQMYTNKLRDSPRRTFIECLRIWNGRISHDNWFRVALRPFVLFAYPSVLWSSAVYSLSVGWLIVLSEAVAEVYRNAESYNFSAMGAGLIYISPFVGGVLGTAFAGRLSDISVRYMTRRNGGIYEPEFRLTMAIPITITTCIGLMGFGWSAEERDMWIVPTLFFGILSFGCTFGSTTAITFCVDSYRQYAAEALVTLNFSKNIFHGFVFAWFLVKWLQYSGVRTVFLSLGGLHVFFMLWSIPMYIYGKRARMWTVRKNFMGKL